MKEIARVAALVLACTTVSALAENSKPDMKTQETEKPEEKKSEGKTEKKPEDRKSEGKKDKKPEGKKSEDKKEKKSEGKKSEDKKDKKSEDKKDKKPKEKKPEIWTPWDIAFGAAFMSDYNFRGITQSNHRQSVAAYFEPRYNFNANLQGYVGLSGESISFPNRAPSEIDFYGGIRPTFGNLALDLGAWYYWYPRGECFHDFIVGCLPTLRNGNVIKADLNFWEIYGKATYLLNDQFSLGGGVYWSPSVLNSGAEGTFVAGTAKYILPPVLPNGIGWFISADVGHWFLGTSDSFYAVPGFPGGIPYKSYNTWDAGLAFTWKQFTLDLRYYDTNLNKGDCNAFTSDHTAGGVFSTPINPGGPGSSWCGATFLAKLSIDLNKDNLKKSEGKTSEEKKPEQKKSKEKKDKSEAKWLLAERKPQEKKPHEKGAAEKKPKESEEKMSGGKKPQEKKPEIKNPWDIASEISFWSEFNIRGISASGHRPSVVPYLEPRYNFSDSLQAYMRLWGNSLRFPNRAAVAINLFAGTRPTFGKLALDYGYWQRWFPGGQCVIRRTTEAATDVATDGPCITKPDLSYWEIFAKATYNVNKQFSYGGGAYWSPSVLNSGDPATYVVGTAKYILPTFRPSDIGWFISGDVGHWFREGTPYPSYTNWNMGLAFTWKQFTLDLRYSDTNNKDCNVARTPNIVIPGPLGHECRATFFSKLTVDLSGESYK